jgi:hypothetical protein
MPTKPEHLVDTTHMPAKQFLELAAQGALEVTNKYKQVLNTDFSEFATNALGLHGFLCAPHNPEPDEERAIREELLGLHRIGLWASTGLNIFSLSEQLTAGFMLTEPPPLEDNKLHVPFPSFVLRVPPGLLPMFIGDKQYWASMIWVHDYYALERSVQGPAHFFRWMVMGHGVTLWRDRNGDDVLRGEQDGDELIQVWDDDPKEVPQDKITLEYGLRIVRNLVAWLDSTGGIVAQKQSSRPSQRHSGQQDPTVPTVWLMGHEVKLPREVVRMAPEIALGHSKHPAPGWQVRTRFVVRGHWRNQAHGEGRQLRTRKWIEPHWRGPEGAAAWSHLYKDEP